jgi:hypothetical protein
MDDFKCLPKMKTGGSVKQVVKKAFAMHDKQSHEGKKTDLSKLCGGGRAMRSGGKACK